MSVTPDMSIIVKSKTIVYPPWPDIDHALTGAVPTAVLKLAIHAAYHLQEEMKHTASTMRSLSEPSDAATRAPYWVLHAYSHWWRAITIPFSRKWLVMYIEEFPDGMNFRRYLAAWICSVGIPQLGMKQADVDAITGLTGIVPCAHPLLPKGASAFRFKPKARRKLFAGSARESLRPVAALDPHTADLPTEPRA